MSDVTNWIGLGLTALALVLGGSVFVQKSIESLRDKMEAKLEAQKKELSETHLRELTAVKTEVAEERHERRRELDQMGETLKGFADVASAVVAMGKSVEHLTEKFSDHQRGTERAMDELKHSIRGIDDRVQQFTKPARVRASRAKG